MILDLTLPQISLDFFFKLLKNLYCQGSKNICIATCFLENQNFTELLKIYQFKA